MLAERDERELAVPDVRARRDARPACPFDDAAPTFSFRSVVMW
jgi:hypothetical protein